MAWYIAPDMDRAPPTEPLARLMRGALPYLLAGAAVSAGVLVRLLLARVLGAELPFITLFPVVFVVAYFLGFGPTVLATVLGIVAAVALFMEPGHGLGVAEPVAQLGALLFGLTGVGIGWLGEARLRARAAAASALQRASAEAERAEEETIRAEEEAARAEEETLRAEDEAQRSARESERVERVLASIGDAFLVVDHR
jgi:K+-sensing histidine kinase KdpD